MIAALDLVSHGGFAKACLRFSSIDHGSQGARSSGGRPPFCAQAVSHAVSHLPTSILFSRRVSKTPYIMAENRAPSRLSDPYDSLRPITGPRRTLSAKLLSMGVPGRSMNTLSPQGVPTLDY